jgi:hypothetical protein
MLISDRQHEANRKNAQQSCGPKSEEGKRAVRFNALTYGLRARATVLPTENPDTYDQLWDAFEEAWQPQTITERCYVETMITSQWLLARLADSERRIYGDPDLDEAQFRMLALVAKQRAQLERSFRTAVADMQQSQRDRQANHPRPQPAPTAKPEPVPAPPSAKTAAPPQAYVMSEAPASHPMFCSPAADSR